MALENPSYLDELVPQNPHGELDDISEGDDHLRNLKTALVNTFPGLAGRAWRKVSRSSSGSITRQHNMTLQAAQAGVTLTANGASTLGNGWMTFVRAPSNGSVNIAASERINGSTNPYTVPAGHIAMLMSDGSEFFAVIMYESTPATPPVFPAGTRMVFHQTTPPAGWTKLTNSQYNDAGLRMTTGVVGVGGADGFTSTFGAGKATSSHTLNIAQMPAHTHTVQLVGRDGTAGSQQHGAWDGGSINTGSTGGGGSHTHSLPNFNLKFVDVIVAEKS